MNFATSTHRRDWLFDAETLVNTARDGEQVRCIVSLQVILALVIVQFRAGHCHFTMLQKLKFADAQQQALHNLLSASDDSSSGDAPEAKKQKGNALTQSWINSPVHSYTTQLHH